MADDIHETALLTCPFCQHEVNRAGAVPGVSTREQSPAPEAGDTFVCIRCGEPAVYERTPAIEYLRKPTSAELRELMLDPDVRLTVARVKHAAEQWKKMQ